MVAPPGKIFTCLYEV